MHLWQRFHLTFTVLLHYIAKFKIFKITAELLLLLSAKIHNTKMTYSSASRNPRPSNRLHRSNGKRKNYQVCSVQYCMQQLCIVQCTHKWTDLTVFWVGFCLTGPILMCLDYFCVCMYFGFITVLCFGIVTWWDGPRGIDVWFLKPLLPSVLWHCLLGHLIHGKPSPIWPIMCLVGR